MKKFGRAIVKLRIPILILSVLLLIPAAIGMINTRINYDILSYLPKDIDTMKGQDLMLEEFGKGGFSMVVVEGMKDKDISKLKEKIEKVENVDSVVSYDSTNVPKEILPQKYYEKFNSKNATMMAVFFSKSTSADETLDAVEEIRDLAKDQCFVSGMSSVVADIKDLTVSEMTLYVIVAVILFSIVLALAMDSFLIPVLFMAGVGMSILYNLGTNFIQGEISFITQALAAVLQLAVTMDYSIFLWHSYKENKTKYPGDNHEAMAVAISQTVVSVVSSSITTVAGFLALCVMTFTLGLDLGIVMAKGVILGVICCVTVLPSMILVFDKALEKTMHRELLPSFEKPAKFIVKHSWIFVSLFVALLIPAVYGETHTDVYYDLAGTLPQDLNSVVANAKLNEEFGMATTHIIMADSSMDSKTVREMTDDIKATDGVSYVLGMDSLIGSSIPSEIIPDSVNEVLKGDKWQLMLVGSEYKIATDEVNNQTDELSKIVKKYDKNAMVIGESAATKDLIDITDRDFKVVNFVSITLVFAIILVALRSVSLPILLVSVIEFAVFINMAVPCYTNTTIPFIASVVIGTIQLGSTVDYAILMTTRYKLERRNGKEKHEAVTIALSTSAHSVIVSAIGFFAATFSVGIVASVDMISQLCTLLSRGALVSMVTVLTILPSMLLLFDKVIVKTTMGMKAKEEKLYKLPAID